jgi:hypothetical protein
MTAKFLVKEVLEQRRRNESECGVLPLVQRERSGNSPIDEYARSAGGLTEGCAGGYTLVSFS